MAKEVLAFEEDVVSLFERTLPEERDDLTEFEEPPGLTGPFADFRTVTFITGATEPSGGDDEGEEAGVANFSRDLLAAGFEPARFG